MASDERDERYVHGDEEPIDFADPTGPEHTVRWFEPSDSAAVREVIRRSHALGGPEGESLDARLAEVDRMLSRPHRAAVALDDGAVVGYVHPIGAMLEVDPVFCRRGHGRRLFEAGRRIAGRLGDQTLELWVPVSGPGRAFAEAVGMKYRASMYRLLLTVGVGVREPGPMAGLAARPIRPGADDASFAALFQACFADHPSPVHVDADRIAVAHARQDFEPTDLELVLEAGGDRLVAFWRTKRDPDAARGEVAFLGVLPGYRRRGIGRWMLRRAVAHLADLGAAEVVLVVDAENEDALRLYLAEGFERVAEWPRWSTPVAPAAPERDRAVRAR